MKKRLSAGILVFLMAFSLGTVPLYAEQAGTELQGSSESAGQNTSASSLADSASKLSKAEGEIRQLEQQLSEAKQLIAGLEGNKSDIESRVRELDEQLSAISGQIDELTIEVDTKNEEIEEAEASIDNTEERLKKAEEKASDQYAAMKKRIQFLYENTQSSDLLRLFMRSGNIADFLSVMEYVNELARYDRDMLTAYEETAREIADYETQLAAEKEQLLAERSELEELKKVAEEQKATVSSLQNAKRSELMQVNTYIDAAENTAEAYEDEIAAQNEVIAEIRAEIAREEERRRAAAASGEVYEERNYDGGVFLWPCPASHRVTSDFGYRTSPTAGASTYHKGIDIGAPYGSAIVAVAPGEVTFAGYSSGAGNYVIVNHGSGLRTVYMHASSLNVSVGQVVGAGDTVAFVGSTGISTGNHLHFGVSLNGEYVSPWNYL